MWLCCKKCHEIFDIDEFDIDDVTGVCNACNNEIEPGCLFDTSEDQDDDDN